MHALADLCLVVFEIVVTIYAVALRCKVHALDTENDALRWSAAHGPFAIRHQSYRDLTAESRRG